MAVMGQVALGGMPRSPLGRCYRDAPGIAPRAPYQGKKAWFGINARSPIIFLIAR